MSRPTMTDANATATATATAAMPALIPVPVPVRMPVPATELIDDAGYELLTQKITRETSFRCASYKDRCLRRRIAARMRVVGATSWPAYATVLDADPDEYKRLLDALTINVTKFFRNPSTFETIARTIVPALWAGEWTIRVWCAGVSSGEEAYSIAALFHRYAESLGEADVVGERVRIIGSDIDRRCIVAARGAMYTPTAFVEAPSDLVERYFPVVGDFRTPVLELRNMVRFQQHDLLNDGPLHPQVDLITCRNVVIYFDREAQERLFTGFHQLLSPQGYLVLGRVETLLGAPRALFRSVESRERIYQRAE